MDRPTGPATRRQGPRQRASATDGHRVRVVDGKREPPELDRFVAALLALALAELDAERGAGAGDDRPGEQSSAR